MKQTFNHESQKELEAKTDWLTDELSVEIWLWLWCPLSQPHSLDHEMEAARTTETLISYHISIQCHNTEDQDTT
jgi:hypothetical protein